MYIISETLAGNDPRFHQSMERIYSNWEYTSYFVPNGVDVSNLTDGKTAIEVEEAVARSIKFANSNDGRIGLRTGTLSHEEVFGESTESDGEKTYYHMTPQDESEVTVALKVEMKLYLNKHFSIISETDVEKWANKKSAVLEEIDSCKTMRECRLLMHKRFGLDSVKGAVDTLGPAKFDLSDLGRSNFS